MLQAWVWHLPMAALPGSSEDSALRWASTPQAAGRALPEHPEATPLPCCVPRSDHSQCLAHQCSLPVQVQEQRSPGPREQSWGRGGPGQSSSRSC